MLMHLAQARWELFQTFCFPSMMQQSNMEYLWIIWVDPHWLQHISPDDNNDNDKDKDKDNNDKDNNHPDVRDQFLSLVSQHPRAIVLASFHNEPQQQQKNQQQTHSNLRTWYGYESFQDLSHHVVAGNVSGLAAYQAASLSHILVETDLDADDALAYRFVETAQRQAAASVGHDVRPTATHSETYCPEYHAEWRFYPEEQQKEDHNNSPKNHHQTFAGQLIHYHNRNFCIKSGMTIVYHLQAQARRLSPCNNHEQDMCCPDHADESGPKRGTEGRGRGRALLVAENDHHHPTENLQVIALWQNPPELAAETAPLNPVNFFESHRHLMMMQQQQDPTRQLNVKYFYDQPDQWYEAVQGCCIVTEEFDDDTKLLPGLTMDSDLGFTFVDPASDMDVWYDVVTDEWQTTLTYAPGFHALGGWFDMAGIGGSGAGVNVIVDGAPVARLTGSKVGFFGFVSTVPMTKVEFRVGDAKGVIEEDVPLVEEYTIDWIKLAFAPQEQCRRRLRTIATAVPEFMLVETSDGKIVQTQPEFQSMEASVLLSRTPTAAGMKHVLLPRTGSNTNHENKHGGASGQNSIALDTYQNEDADAAQEMAWQYMETEFGISAKAVAQVHHDMTQDMTGILINAMAGQCTPGHSCKSSSKQALGQLLDQERFFFNRNNRQQQPQQQQQQQVVVK